MWAMLLQVIVNMSNFFKTNSAHRPRTTSRPFSLYQSFSDPITSTTAVPASSLVDPASSQEVIIRCKWLDDYQIIKAKLFLETNF